MPGEIGFSSEDEEVNASNSDEDSVGRGGNRARTREERNRRTAERRLLRDNNPFSNLEQITQRLGREAAERFRSMIEERKMSTITKVSARIDKEWLRKYYDEDVISLIGDREAASVRALVENIGPIGGLLIIRLK